MPKHSLMAIVEVDKKDRISCQAAGCKRPVFKQIHVIREGGSFKVLGRECYKKLYCRNGVRDQKPYYGSSEGRRLTDEERHILIENTQKFIERLEDEHTQIALSVPAIPNNSRFSTNQPLYAALEPSEMTLGISHETAERRVKSELRKMGINPDLPGWVGLVQSRIKKLTG